MGFVYYIILKSENEAEKYDNNAITRGIGLEETIEIDTYVLDISEGSTYLLCSDGVYKMISREDMLEIQDNVSKGFDISYVGNLLIEKAIAAGGLDNITAVLIAT